jgi:GMP synthase (glutamine-hydrolysing)
MATVILEHSDRTRSDRLGEILRNHGHRLRVIQLHHDDPVPPDLDGIDAIISCGGPQSPLDDSLDWLEPQMELIRQAHASAVPILGLCLGCQIVTRALGGEVAELEGGPEIGWHEVRLTSTGREDPLYAGHAWSSMQIHWHRFHAATPPPGARVLAASDRTPVQAWALGLRTYAIQYHPESYPETIDGWAEQDPATVDQAGLSRETLRAQTDEHYQAMARLASRIFELVALVLMPLDRRFAGIVKDLHH